LELLKYIFTGTFTSVLALTDTNVDRFQGGGRILLGRTLGPNTGLEVSYFDVADWRGTAIVRDVTELDGVAFRYGDGSGDPTVLMRLPGSLFSPLSDYGAWLEEVDMPTEIPFDGNNLAQITYSSSLDNLEWNLRQWVVRVPGCTQVSLLLGGRYMNVNETFCYYTHRNADPEQQVTEATTGITTETRNPMIGAQIGGTYEACVMPGWWLDFELKGAAFSNGARQSTVFFHQGDDSYQGTHLENAARRGIASVLDATFTTRFAVGPHAAVDLSYQLLYVSGLALAPDNFSDDPDVLLYGPASVNTSGSVLYHGLQLGLTCVW